MFTVPYIIFKYHLLISGTLSFLLQPICRNITLSAKILCVCVCVCVCVCFGNRFGKSVMQIIWFGSAFT